jgi:type I restriction enzyme S subunit
MANRNLVLQDLKRIEVPIPPPSNQRWITVILNKQMSEVDRLRESLDAQLEGINKLPAALLRRAFRGELG